MAKKRGRKSHKSKVAAAFGKAGLARKYNALKAEYKRVGAQLFKANHGGKTIREYNASKRRKRRAKHRKSR